MARIRTIKPDFWDSADTARADLRTRLLYIAMWNWADDYGIGDGHPGRIINFAFPSDDIPASDYPRLLADVSGAFGVVFFEHLGRPYYTVPAWDKHQRTEKKAKAKDGLLEAAAEAVERHETARQAHDAESPRNVADSPTHSSGTADAGSRKSEGEREVGKGKDFGGATEVTHLGADDVAPAQKCPRHEGHPNPPDCGGCAQARRAFQAWEAQQAKEERDQLERQRQKRLADTQRLTACTDCDEEGWRYDDREIKCKHQEAVNA